MKFFKKFGKKGKPKDKTIKEDTEPPKVSDEIEERTDDKVIDSPPITKPIKKPNNRNKKKPVEIIKDDDTLIADPSIKKPKKLICYKEENWCVYILGSTR